jgi:hypothetical protein
MDINSDKYAGITQRETSSSNRMSLRTVLLCRRCGICAKQEYTSTFWWFCMLKKKYCTTTACAEHEGTWNVLLKF